MVNEDLLFEALQIANQTASNYKERLNKQKNPFSVDNNDVEQLEKQIFEGFLEIAETTASSIKKFHDYVNENSKLESSKKIGNLIGALIKNSYWTTSRVESEFQLQRGTELLSFILKDYREQAKFLKENITKEIDFLIELYPSAGHTIKDKLQKLKKSGSKISPLENIPDFEDETNFKIHQELKQLHTNATLLNEILEEAQTFQANLFIEAMPKFLKGYRDLFTMDLITLENENTKQIEKKFQNYRILASASPALIGGAFDISLGLPGLGATSTALLGAILSEKILYPRFNEKESAQTLMTLTIAIQMANLTTIPMAAIRYGLLLIDTRLIMASIDFHRQSLEEE